MGQRTFVGQLSTGYGKVTREFLKRIKYPDEIINIATGGLSTGPYIEVDGIKVLPGMAMERGKGDVIMPNLKQQLAQEQCTHWVFHNDAWAYAEVINDVGKQYPCIVYSPIDGGTISEKEKYAIRPAQERVAMSKYAHEEIKNAGMSSTYIPHGVDTNIYKPQDQDDWREIMHLPKDEFIFGFVGTNISKRKGQAEMMMGSKRLMMLV